MTLPRRALLIGSIGRTFPIVSHASDEILVVWLADAGDSSEAASAVISERDVAVSVECLTATGDCTGRFQVPARLPLLDGPCLSAAFVDHIVGTAGVRLTDFTPWLLWQLSPDRGQLRVEVLLASRSRQSGTSFARVSSLSLPLEASSCEIYRALPDFAPELVQSITMEWLNFTRLEAGTEIEVKLGLPAGCSIWSLASRFHRLVRDGSLPGFVPDLGIDLQRWQFSIQMYEVLGPPAEEGYISFSPNPTGTFVMQRKVFLQDGIRRQEAPTQTITVPDRDLDRYLHDRYPELIVRGLPPFHRTRFDINVESSRTGHVFGIVVDEVYVPSHEATLQQVELEYFRSRVHDGYTAESIQPELERLTAEVSGVLAAMGIEHQRYYYSKRSFLRDLVAAQGEPAPVTAPPRPTRA